MKPMPTLNDLLLARTLAEQAFAAASEELRQAERTFKQTAHTLVRAKHDVTHYLRQHGGTDPTEELISQLVAKHYRAP
jgi:hypothetical protein